MESILIVQKVAGGFVDPPARMYAGPAEGYSGGVYVILRRHIF